MILDVHVAYLVASLSVLFGITYSVGRFLDIKMEKMREAGQVDQAESAKIEVLVS